MMLFDSDRSCFAMFYRAPAPCQAIPLTPAGWLSPVRHPPYVLNHPTVICNRKADLFRATIATFDFSFFFFFFLSCLACDAPPRGRLFLPKTQAAPRTAARQT